MATDAPSLSSAEFQQMQEQLLELRTANYELSELSKKREAEIVSLKQQHKSDNNPLNNIASIGNNLLSRTTGKKDQNVEHLETEVVDLRRRLQTQEEEFRLQQATLMSELNKVVTHADELERELEAKKTSSNLPDVDVPVQTAPVQAAPVTDDNPSDLAQELSALKKELNDANTSKKLLAEEKEIQQSEFSTKFVDLEKEIAWLKGVCAEKDSLKDDVDVLRQQILQAKHKSEQDNKEIAELKDNYRKKQESYVILTQEKERLQQEYRKSLDTMCQKKDNEISTFLSEIQQLRQQLTVVAEFENKQRVWEGERASLEDRITSLRADCSELRDQNESFQMQLQETHSANDCLSAQLQEAHNEVKFMQSKVEEAVETAEKRKQLVDEMSVHIEQLKNEHRQALDAAEKKQKATAEQLQTELDAKSGVEMQQMKEQLAAADEAQNALRYEVGQLQQLLAEAKESLQRASESHTSQLKAMEEQHAAAVAQVRLSAQSDCENALARIASIEKEKTECMELVARLNQEVKDKTEEIKLSEKKQTHVIKDLRRQLAAETKKADKLAEKAHQDGAAQGGRDKRNGSPGSFEEVKASDIVDVRRPPAHDASSVSSWGLVTGTNGRCESDRQSNHTADGDESVSSVHQLESENADLIGRLACSQKERYDLVERVHHLEQANASMAKEIVEKATLIETYIRDRPGAFNSSGASETTGSPSHTGFKKMLDMVKIDQSAGDIREMNRRLQRMLEETLTKNMHLQKDLERLASNQKNPTPA
uniref:Uncharacterized protein n=1 Tax=Plectus sambesii TaxID=2011161 RepID=A0A914X3P9_9BILA